MRGKTVLLYDLEDQVDWVASGHDEWTRATAYQRARRLIAWLAYPLHASPVVPWHPSLLQVVDPPPQRAAQQG